jgi:hypothetical protein
MASTYLSKTLGTATNSKIWTFSTWLKRSGLSSTQHIFSIDNGSDRDAFSFDSDDGLRLYFNSSISPYADLSTNRLLRDTSAFYHLVLTVDTTQATADDRVKLYINGTQYTWDETTIDPALNYDTFNASGNTFRIGRDRTAANYFDGILTHTHFTDGYAYDASDFGQTDATTGIWKPKGFSGSYGTNGFFLKFESSGSMGLDSSGNANNFTVSGNLIQTVDTPSNVFVTFNPLDTKRTSSSTPLFQNGNTTAYNAASDGSYLASAMAVNKGKWYAEFKVGAGANTRNFGILDVTSSLAYIGNPASGNATNSYAYNSLSSGGLLRDGNTTIASSVGTTTNGDIVSVMIDLDSATKTIKFQKNGVDLSGTTQMTISQSSDTYWIFALRADNDQYVYANFGNGYFGTTAVSSAGSNGNGAIFEYDVPTGYYALCTKNINTYG